MLKMKVWNKRLLLLHNLQQMQQIMTMLNAPDIEALKQSQLIFDQQLLSWMEQRHIDIDRGL